MLTIKFSNKKISDSIELSKYIRQNTGIEYKLYNNFELSQDKNYKNDLLKQFELFDKYMLEMCIADVEDKLNSREVHKKIIKKEIEKIKNVLSKIELNTKYEKRNKFKLIKKLAELERNKDKDICFGSKALMRQITKVKQRADSKHKDVTKEERKKQKNLYQKYLAQYQKKREIGIYLIGRACEGGNRKVDFDLVNNRIIFKPRRETHIEITFNSSKKQDKVLAKLDAMAKNNSIPITVRIDNEFTYLMYDEELLNGYAFDKNSYKKHLHKYKIKKGTNASNEVYKMFCDEQRQRQLKGKKETRYATVDINPYEIGLVIADKINNEGDFAVVTTKCFKFKILSNKLGIESDHKDQIYQNNKRKHELKEIWNKIFELVKNYKCAYFTNENLKFKLKYTDSNGKEFNRITKNIWHRTLTTNLIRKFCNINGIINIPVNPVYSSFIGNLIYEDYDPIAAAMELTRRGIVKYIKGSKLYPPLSRINQEKLVYLLGENSDNEWTSWRQLYNFISKAGLRYRNRDCINSYSVHNMSNHKSMVHVYFKQAA